MGVKSLLEVADEALGASCVETVDIQTHNGHMAVACGGKRRLGAVKRVRVRLLERPMHDMQGGKANGRRHGLMGGHNSLHEVRGEAMWKVLDQVR